MTNDALTYAPIPLADMEPDVREIVEAEAEASGFVPNVFAVLARRPAEFHAFYAYYQALMSKEGGNLTKADRELIVVATSALNGCLYCIVSHGALLRLFSKDAQIADRVGANPHTAPLPSRQRAIVDYAVKLARTPELVTRADAQRLLDAGFDAEDLWDIAAITGFFALSNRMAIATEMQPNDEFYVLGRVPRDVYTQLTSE